MRNVVMASAVTPRRRVLVIGGLADTSSNLSDHLKEENLDVISWPVAPGEEERIARRQIPTGILAVILITNSMPHSLSDKIAKEARKRNLTIVFGSRQWSHTRPLLVKAKILESAAPTPVAQTAAPTPTTTTTIPEAALEPELAAMPEIVASVPEKTGTVTPPNKLWEGLVWARKEDNVTPDVVAECLNVSIEKYNGWEAGHRIPNALQLKQLVDLLPSLGKVPIVTQRLELAGKIHERVRIMPPSPPVQTTPPDHTTAVARPTTPSAVDDAAITASTQDAAFVRAARRNQHTAALWRYTEIAPPFTTATFVAACREANPRANYDAISSMLTTQRRTGKLIRRKDGTHVRAPSTTPEVPMPVAAPTPVAPPKPTMSATSQQTVSALRKKIMLTLFDLQDAIPAKTAVHIELTREGIKVEVR